MKEGSTKKAASGQESLPEWSLGDLYPGMESEEYRRDVASCVDEAKAFEARVKSKLAAMLEEGEPFAAAIREYEAIGERMGRVMSYAGLVYAGDTDDPGIRSSSAMRMKR